MTTCPECVEKDKRIAELEKALSGVRYVTDIPFPEPVGNPMTSCIGIPVIAWRHIVRSAEASR